MSVIVRPHAVRRVGGVLQTPCAYKTLGFRNRNDERRLDSETFTPLAPEQQLFAGTR
jgi:hypothetical protein